MIKFKDFLFKKLPLSIQLKDKGNFVNNQGEGLLQRWLQLLGTELDDNTIKHLEELPNIKDPSSLIFLTSVNRDKLLDYIAYEIGTPPDPTKDIEEYKKLCLHNVTIRRFKGSITGYQLFFKLYKYLVEISYPSLLRGYDSALYDISNYDDVSFGGLFTEYSIILTDLNPADPHPITPELMASFRVAVENYLQPIIMTLVNIEYRGSDYVNILQWPDSVYTVVIINKDLILQ